MNTRNPLTAGVYGVLVAGDLGCAWRFSQQYVEPKSDEIIDHIRAMNRFWREQLATGVCDTSIVRSFLIDRCDPDDWLRLFADNVAPVVVALDLPQVIRDDTEVGPGWDYSPRFAFGLG